LAIKHKFERINDTRDFKQRRVDAQTGAEVRAITNEETIAEAHMTVRHRTEIQDLRDAQAAEIAQNGGRDPDAPARIGRQITAMHASMNQFRTWIVRQWANLEHRNHYITGIEELRDRAREMLADADITPLLTTRLNALIEEATRNLDGFIAVALQDAEFGGAIRGWGGQGVDPAQRLGARAMALPAVQQQQLARIANDAQNVHTQLVVEQTKKNVQEILKIPVPEVFKWQTKRLSMTYKTIVMFCHLTPKSAWQFSAMYCSDATIYDLEPGIFGKVVDGVWQFISKSPNKADLKKILSAELRDNIGMCAQGNLSRMCNVLQGYLDGIGQTESVSEILGREFPKLMEIENAVEREARGAAILRENNVPDDQWDAWLEPLRA
jgi:hypothetical protein